MSNPRNNTLWAGADGGEIIDDTAAHTGNFGVIQVVNAAVIAAITAPGLTNAAGLVGLTLPALYELRTEVTSITLTSGVVHARSY